MTRALVLNAGASLCSYQVGALRHLVGERRWRFDLCAGTGIGAMNAALVACGQLDALVGFWADARPWDLMPSRRRRFLEAHLSEKALIERGATVIVTALNLQTGRLETLRYPGSALPIVDGVLAAGAMPGLVAPVTYQGHQLVEGTLIDAVPLSLVLEDHPDEVVAILATLPVVAGPPRRYRTWRAVLGRSIDSNQAHDGRRALADAGAHAATGAAYRQVAASVPQALARAGVSGDRLAERLAQSLSSHQPMEGPRLVAIRPSRPLGYPMWRFRRSDLAAAMALGERDAKEQP